MNSHNQDTQSDSIRSSQSVTRPSDADEADKIIRDVEKGEIVNAVNESNLELVRILSSHHHCPNVFLIMIRLVSR
jgi:hypothetical protein